MDLYYQNYRTDEDFLRLQHFVYLCGVAYSKILEDEYKEARKESKIDEVFADIFLQDDWLVEETVQMKKDEQEDETYYGYLKRPVFSFPYDPFSYGIQSVRRAGKTTCTQFVRTAARESWMDCLLPTTTRNYFYRVSDRIIVKGARCKLDTLILQVVPEITDPFFGSLGGPVPGAKEDMIIRKTMEIILRARDGVTVDMSNNSNPNKALQTEIDNVFPNLRTKPV